MGISKHASYHLLQAFDVIPIRASVNTPIRSAKRPWDGVVSVSVFDAAHLTTVLERLPTFLDRRQRGPHVLPAASAAHRGPRDIHGLRGLDGTDGDSAQVWCGKRNVLVPRFLSKPSFLSRS